MGLQRSRKPTRPTPNAHFLEKLVRTKPCLFEHWRIGIPPDAERRPIKNVLLAMSGKCRNARNLSTFLGRRPPRRLVECATTSQDPLCFARFRALHLSRKRLFMGQ